MESLGWKGNLILLIVIVIIMALFTHVGPTVEHGAETTGPVLPSHFEVQEENTVFVTNMSLVAGGQTVGTIDEKSNGSLKTFEYRDTAGKLIASGQVDGSILSTTINVWTNEGNKIGTIKEDTSQGSWTTTVYSILNAAGNQLATSKKTGFFSPTLFKLSDEGGAPVATVARTAQYPLDIWSVTVQQPGVVDPRLLVMISAFKTGHDSHHND
jgi:hypothetical protein